MCHPFWVACLYKEGDILSNLNEEIEHSKFEYNLKNIDVNEIEQAIKKGLLSIEKSLIESMSGIGEKMLLWYKNLSISLLEMEKWINKNREQLKHSINELSSELATEKGCNIFLVTIFLENNPNFLNSFISEGLCPPIFYLIKDIAIDDMVRYDKEYTEKIDIEKLPYDISVEKYYIDSMNEWIEDEEDNYIKDFIKEIQVNFEQGNIYTTTLSLFTLIEYKVRKTAKATGNPIGESRITQNIIQVLEENCFKYKKSLQLEKLGSTFFDRNSEYYIYKSTSKEPTFITRHVLHGEKLNLINKNNMMSLIFLTDLLYKILIDEPV